MQRLGIRARTATLLLAVLLGIAFGIGGYTFVYAKGYSYLTDDPAACANCHVMLPQFQSWSKAPHHAVASCNDCHTPSGFFAKYGVKALNGFNHSLAFTTGRFHEPIRANRMNQRVAREACTKCHAELVQSISHGAALDTEAAPDCTHCHGSVGHPH
ncbi:MAG TPA: cytochrome c nitrite reductase small subunit [Polyangiaceae bacterium]|nr:cytochrome c nitrite reductase small subunit [Polyangiaceae bacterium]